VWCSQTIPQLALLVDIAQANKAMFRGRHVGNGHRQDFFGLTQRLAQLRQPRLEPSVKGPWRGTLKEPWEGALGFNP